MLTAQKHSETKKYTLPEWQGAERIQAMIYSKGP